MTTATGDVIECKAEWRNGPEKAMIVRHYKVSSVSDTDDNTFLQGAADELRDLLEAMTDGIMANETYLVLASAQRLSPTETRIYTAYSTMTPVTTTAVAQGAQEALLCSLYPDAGSSSKSGRNYVPFIRSDYVNEGQIIGTNVSTILAFLESVFKDPIVLAAIGEIIPIILKKDGGLVSEITSIVLRTVLATQRRRVDFHQNYA